MITLLCSYGVLVYELLHRSGGGSESSSVLDPEKILERVANKTLHNASHSTLHSTTESFHDDLFSLYENMSLGAHSY